MTGDGQTFTVSSMKVVIPETKWAVQVVGPPGRLETTHGTRLCDTIAIAVIELDRCVTALRNEYEQALADNNLVYLDVLAMLRVVLVPPRRVTLTPVPKVLP